VRGDTRGRALPTGLLIALAGAVLVLLVVTGVVLRPWTASRELLPGPPSVWLTLRGNAFGSHCELVVRNDPVERIPFQCGVYGNTPEWGDRDVFRTGDLQGQTCVVELSPLRVVTCIGERPEWMRVRPDYVSIGAYVSGELVVIEVDRATQVVERFALPPGAYVDEWAPGGLTVVVPLPDGGVRQMRLERGGLAPSTP
jgi:hypothetical protein